MIGRFRDQDGVQSLRSVLSRQQCLDKISANLRGRYNAIVSSFSLNIRNPAEGFDVAAVLVEFKALAAVVHQHMEYCARRLTDREQRCQRDLLDILLGMLSFITKNDEDLYSRAGAPRPHYAGTGNAGRLFRQFVNEPTGLMNVFARINDDLLRQRKAEFRAIVAKVVELGPSNGDQTQYTRLRNMLDQLWRRK